MSVWLTNLADVLRGAGVDVVEMRYERGPYAGKTWKQVGFNSRGLTELRGVMWHHDASPVGDSGSAKVVNGYGVSPTGALGWCMYMDIAPAAAAWIDMRGVWHLYAAGLSNHAGLGSSVLAPANTGNQFYYGIETDHTTGEAWPAAQLDSLRRGTAAIMTAYDLDPAKALEFHKTYAPGRKNDPDGLELANERAVVGRMMKPVETAKADKLKRRRRKWRRKRDSIRATGKTAGIPTARKRIRSLTQRINKILGR